MQQAGLTFDNNLFVSETTTFELEAISHANELVG
jgi:hypothetical protein